MENYKISSDSEQGNNEWQTVCSITMISVMTVDKVKLTGIMYGGVQFQSDTRQLNGNKYGELK